MKKINGFLIVLILTITIFLPLVNSENDTRPETFAEFKPIDTDEYVWESMNGPGGGNLL